MLLYSTVWLSRGDALQLSLNKHFYRTRLFILPPRNAPPPPSSAIAFTSPPRRPAKTQQPELRREETRGRRDRGRQAGSRKGKETKGGSFAGPSGVAHRLSPDRLSRAGGHLGVPSSLPARERKREKERETERGGKAAPHHGRPHPPPARPAQPLLLPPLPSCLCVALRLCAPGRSRFSLQRSSQPPVQSSPLGLASLSPFFFLPLPPLLASCSPASSLPCRAHSPFPRIAPLFSSPPPGRSSARGRFPLPRFHPTHRIVCVRRGGWCCERHAAGTS